MNAPEIIVASASGSDHNSDLFEFIPESTQSICDASDSAPWNILIVDDDQEVHESTVLALHHAIIHGRPLSFDCAGSAAQARELLHSGIRFHAILLDIALETYDAGARLIRELRETPEFVNLKIIVRTGRAAPRLFHGNGSTLQIEGFVYKIEQTPQRLIDLLTEVLSKSVQ